MRRFKEVLKKYRRTDLVVPVCVMAALLVVSFLVVQFLGRAERITVKEPLYQFVFQDRDQYPEGIVMKKTEETVLIDNGVQQYETNGYPFYYEERDAMILTDSFLYLDRSGEIGGKVDYFTVLEKKEGAGCTLDDGAVSLPGGMLHDGHEVYIFLEDTDITYNGKTRSIPAFSYVVCFQGESILICGYGEDAVYEELGEEGASAMMENGIKVDLANDIYYKANGTKHLLFTDPGIFDPVK